jgi:myosin protein heavy chain
LRNQLQDRTQYNNDLQAQLKRRDDDLNKAIANMETDAATKAAFQKQIRDFQSKLDDLQADMESERESRKRLEREKRELMEEIESLRHEILDTTDISHEMVEREKKREEELSTLKRVLDQGHKDREAIIIDLRSKHAKEIEELTSQFENTKRQLQTFGKDRQLLQNDIKDRDNQIKDLNALKQDIERKRRQLETYVQDLLHKFNESERIKNETLDKSQRCQQDIESLNAAYIEAEQRLQNHERTINMLKQENQELQENLQDENRQKMNVLAKLRQTEDLLAELKDRLEDRDEERHKIETKLIQLTQQNSELRREAELVNVEQIEEIRRQLQREKDALLQELDSSKSLNSKISKSNQKLTNDIADLNVELERYRSIVQNVEKQQRIFEKRMQEEKNLQEKLRQERDKNEKEIREKETQRLNLLKELDEQNLAYEDLDKRYKQLRDYIDSTSQVTDDVGRYIQELEKNNRNLGKKQKKRRVFHVVSSPEMNEAGKMSRHHRPGQPRSKSIFRDRGRFWRIRLY